MADATKKTAKAATKAVEVKTLEQLKEELLTAQNDHRESRRSHQLGELVNPHVLTVQRKAIARALTAIKQAEIEASAKTTAVKEEN